MHFAGALAARVREQKQPVLTAIGVDAVSNAVLAIGNARLFLEQNNLVRAMQVLCLCSAQLQRGAGGPPPVLTTTRRAVPLLWLVAGRARPAGVCDGAERGARAQRGKAWRGRSSWRVIVTASVA